MLSFRNRFHGHGSLRYVYSNGKSVRTHLMTIKTTSHPKRKDPRIAIVISKKIIKSAVGRNRVRRRMYEIMRRELPDIKPGSDIVAIIFSAEVRTMEHPELEALTKQSLEQLGVYKTNL